MGETAQQPAALSTRQPIPGVASLRVNPERIERMWQMTTQQRVEAAQQGQFTLGEMLRWASRRPNEVPIIDGDFFFLSAYLADCVETADPADTSPVDAKASRDTSQPTPAAAASDMSRGTR